MHTGRFKTSCQNFLEFFLRSFRVKNFISTWIRFLRGTELWVEKIGYWLKSASAISGPQPLSLLYVRLHENVFYESKTEHTWWHNLSQCWWSHTQSGSKPSLSRYTFCCERQEWVSKLKTEILKVTYNTVSKTINNH
jgi:hypothetical protein